MSQAVAERIYYSYADAQGELLYQVVRIPPKTPEGKKTFLQRRRWREGDDPKRDKGGWLWSVTEKERVLYRLPDVVAAVAAEPSELVWFVEGEKDVETLRSGGLVATCLTGGSNSRWADTYSDALRGAQVVLLGDNDDPGREFMARVASELNGVASRAQPLVLPNLPEHGDVTDWLALEGNSFDDLVHLEAGILPQWLEDLPPVVRSLPVVEVQLDEKAMTDQAEEALVDAGLPIYQRSGELVRVGPDDEGAPAIQTLPEPTLRETLSSVAQWKRKKQIKGKWELVPTPVPPVAVRALYARGRWGLPVLLGVRTTPAIRPDGSLLYRPGFDSATRVYYKPMPGVSFPRVPMNPTKSEAMVAMEVLDEPLREFPFVGATDLAGTLASFLTIVGREAIEGPVPMFFFDATTAGSGKGLMANVVALGATGRSVPERSAPNKGKNSEEEDEKVLVTIGRRGDPVSILDNAVRPIGGCVWSSALTAWPEWQGRLLGSNKDARFRLPVFLVTGNNMQVADDMARRVIPVSIDAKAEHPELREFERSDLLGFVKKQHPRLVAAALTVLRWRFTHGKPSGAKPLGSYERWSWVVRDSLLLLGYSDPVEGQQRIRESGDPYLVSNRLALTTWHDALGEMALTVKQLVKHAGTDRLEDLADALAGLDDRLKTEALDPKRIGKRLAKLAGRIVGGVCLERVGKASSGVVLWRVRRVT